MRSRTAAGDDAKRSRFRRRYFSRKKVDQLGFKRSPERGRICVSTRDDSKPGGPTVTPFLWIWIFQEDLNAQECSTFLGSNLF